MADGRVFPDKLVQRVINCELTSSSISMFFAKDIYVQIQQDDFKQESSFLVAFGEICCKTRAQL